MVTINRAQLAALRTLIQKVDIEQIVLEEAREETEEGIKLHLLDLPGDTTTLLIDKWGQGRLVG